MTDGDRAGLLIVDVQNDFCPGGALPVPHGDHVVDVLNEYIDDAVAQGMTVYASRDWHPAVTDHFKPYGGAWPPHCVQDTSGARFHPGLRLPSTTIVITKGEAPNRPGYSALEGHTGDGTPFLADARKRGITHLYVGGLATDYCVKHSVFDALSAGLTIAVLEDAIAGVDVEPGDSARAIADMRARGAELVAGRGLAAIPSQSAVDVLEVSQLSVRFEKTDVLRDVSFRVRAGTTLAVIGPNGSGKTVLFRALIGAIPHEGSIRWAPGVRLGYVPQKLDIERDVPITGLDFLHAHPMRQVRTTPSVSEALALVGLSLGASEKPIGALSGGQFQRLLIAFALVGGPTVLLLDEPTAGVDEPGEERLNTLVHRLQHEQHLTVLLISHELTVVSRYATNVLCLGAGQTWFGPPNRTLTGDVLQQLFGMPTALHVHEH